MDHRRLGARCLVPICLVAWLVGCGAPGEPSSLADGGSSSAEQSRPSPTNRDAYVPPPPPDGEPPLSGCAPLGNTCEDDGDCCGMLSCIVLQTGLKICTRGCSNDQTWTPLVDEDDCPSGSRCLRPPGDVVCARLCQPELGETTCPAGSACRPESAELLGETNKAACAYPACSDDKDCPVLVAASCTVGAAAGSADSCARVGPEAFCVADAPGEQSASTSRHGHCAFAGKCDLPSGLCKPHSQGSPTAAVGDTCDDDRDCGAQMRCLREQRSSPERARWRNGYCTIDGCSFSADLPHLGCPSGSTCFRYHPGGRCLATCAPSAQGGCRGVDGDRYGDYECYAWNRYWLGKGVRFADQPVCDTPDQPIYHYFAQSAQAGGCAGLGEQQNPQQMTCRDPLTAKPASPAVSDCLCLDTTASGPL